MATVTKKPVIPAPLAFTLELSAEEAQALYRLVNRGHYAIGGTFTAADERLTTALWTCMADAGFHSHNSY